LAAGLKLTYGGFITYLDRTRALEQAEVTPDGIELETRMLEWSEHDPFRRVAAGEFDVAEMSVAMYLARYAAGDRSLIGIPVFPSRAFRHNTLFVNTEAGIDVPADLRGRRLGVASYQTTASLWVRAMLAHDYGVQPSDIAWRCGGYYEPENAETDVADAPPGVEIQSIPPGKWLRQMFIDGELDALLTFDAAPYKRLAPRLRRLFPDFRAVEREYLRRTGFFPIMHAVVMRREVYEANPWAATSLLEAFIRSKRLGLERLKLSGSLAVGLPWLELAVDEVGELFDGDAFPYGFGANRPVLEAMTTYAREQHLTGRKLDPEELFAPETIDHPGDAMP
jgi:4,5-dihydroxyphthalate decarboxylase